MSKVIAYLKEVREIFRQITWPKKEALIQLTVVVISVSIVISLILGGFDYLFTNSINFLGNIKNQPQAVPSLSPKITIPAVSPSVSSKPTITIPKPKK